MYGNGAITPALGWQRLLAHLDRGTILVVGGPASGKTSLARWLVGQLGRGLDRVALVDCDPGQTSIGVPGCLGMAITGPWEAPAALWFVGATSPPGHLLPAVVGAARLVSRARSAGAQAVILDSSGLVAGGAARALHYHLALAAEVDQVVVIGGSGDRDGDGAEVEEIVGLLQGEGRTVERVSSSAAARDRGPGARRDYREARFAAHLQGGRARWVSPRRVFGADWRGEASDGLAEGTVVGFLDGEGFCLGLGIVEEVHEDRVAVYTAVTDVPLVRLQAGRFRLDREGRELPPAVDSAVAADVSAADVSDTGVSATGVSDDDRVAVETEPDAAPGPNRRRPLRLVERG